MPGLLQCSAGLCLEVGPRVVAAGQCCPVVLLVVLGASRLSPWPLLGALGTGCSWCASGVARTGQWRPV